MPELSKSMTLARFLDTVSTGRVLRRLSPHWLGRLTGADLWPEAMSGIVKLGVAHPAAQAKFLDTWARVGGSLMIKETGDDDLFFSALRVLMPSYEGSSIQLWRGQRANDPLGFSWSRSLHIAVKFALFGTANVNPLSLPKRLPSCEGAALLNTEASPRDIVCAPCLHGHLEGEYVVDPRGLSVKRIPLGGLLASLYPDHEVARLTGPGRFGDSRA